MDDTLPCTSSAERAEVAPRACHDLRALGSLVDINVVIEHFCESSSTSVRSRYPNFDHLMHNNKTGFKSIKSRGREI